MAKRDTKEKNTRRNKQLSGDSATIDKHNITVDKRYKRKVMLLEDATGDDIFESLKEFGSYNFTLKDIASLLDIPRTKLQLMMDKGERDFKDDIASDERRMHVAYKYGKLSLESNAVVNMMSKNPDKLLAILNPDIYSDKITDKYDMPKIVINFGANIDEEELVKVEKEEKED